MKKETKDIFKTFVGFQLSLFLILSNIPEHYFGIKKFFLIVLPTAVIYNEPSKTVGEMIQSTCMFLFSAIMTTLFSIAIIEPMRKISMLLVIFSLFFFLFVVSFIRQINRVRFRAPCNAAFSLVIINALSGNQPIMNDEFAAFRPFTYLKVYLLAAIITLLCNITLFPVFAVQVLHVELEELVYSLSLVYYEQKIILQRILKKQTKTTNSHDFSCSDSFLEEQKEDDLTVFIKHVSNISKKIVIIEKLLNEAEAEVSYSTFEHSKYKELVKKLRSLVSVLELLLFPFQDMIKKEFFKINKDFPLLFQQLFFLESTSYKKCKELSETLSGLFGINRKQNIERKNTDESFFESETLLPKMEVKSNLLDTEAVLKEIKISLNQHREQSILNVNLPLSMIISDFEEMEILYSVFFELRKQLLLISELKENICIFYKKKSFYFPFHLLIPRETPKSLFVRTKETKKNMKIIRYSLLHSFVICFLSLFFVFSDTQTLFMKLKGHWTLLAICAVFSPTAAESGRLGVWRTFGSIGGGLWAIVVWVFCKESFWFLLLSSPFVFLFLFINYKTSYSLLSRVSLTTFSAITTRKIAEVSGASLFIVSIEVLALQRTALICLGVIVSIFTNLFLFRSFANAMLNQEICFFLLKIKRSFCIMFEECKLLEGFISSSFEYCQKESLKTDFSIDTVSIQKQILKCKDLIPIAENESFVWFRISKENYVEYLKRCERLVIRLSHTKEIIKDINEQVKESKRLFISYEKKELSFFIEKILKKLYFSFSSFSSGNTLCFLKKTSKNNFLFSKNFIMKSPKNASLFSYFLMDKCLQDLRFLRELELKLFPCF